MDKNIPKTDTRKLCNHTWGRRVMLSYLLKVFYVIIPGEGVGGGYIIIPGEGVGGGETVDAVDESKNNKIKFFR